MSEDSPYKPTTEKLQMENGSSGQIQNGDSEHAINGGAGLRYEDDPDTKCGIGAFKPQFLQMFARIGVFVGTYSISGLLTSSLAVYVNSQVSMLEKQFGFSSAETGVLMSCNDIGYLIFALFCGYFASKFHAPRVLGWSTILFGICGIMCALPYFIQDKSVYDIDQDGSNITGAGGRKKVPMCDVTNASLNEYGCSTSNSEEAAFNLEELRIKRVAYWLIAIGMVFQGVGKSVRGPFLTLYIDDAVDKRKTGFYMGIIIGTSIFGPALAYLLGGVFSKLYVTLKAVDITPTDPRWLGAWWLGFLAFGGCALVFSVPLMCFPRKLRSRKRRLEENPEAVKLKAKNEDETFLKQVIKEMRGFLLAMFRVLKNPTFTIIALSSCVNIIGVSGVLSFMPKYIASQYSIPLWKANIILALSSITAVSIGTFVGGVLTRRINMSPIMTCKLLILFYFGNIICQISGFFLGCSQPVLVGDNPISTYPDLYSPTNATCLQGCFCNDEKYFPVCGDDGITYYSPCHAGCTVKKGGMGFSNCTCIPSGMAKAGLCEQGCSTNLYVYAAFTFIGKFVTAMKIVPTFIAKIRCVAEKDRAVATATGSFLTSIIGWMPGPVIFGMIIDNTCLLWKYTCGERQSCQLYNIDYFRTAIHAYGSIASTSAMLCIGILYIYFRVKGVTEWRSAPSGPKKNLLTEGGEREKEVVPDNKS